MKTIITAISLSITAALMIMKLVLNINFSWWIVLCPPLIGLLTYWLIILVCVAIVAREDA